VVRLRDTINMQLKYYIHFYTHAICNVPLSQPNIMVSELSAKSDTTKQIGGGCMRRDLQCQNGTINSMLDVWHCATTVVSI